MPRPSPPLSRAWLVGLALAALAVLSLGPAVAFGSEAVPLGDVYRALWHRLAGGAAPDAVADAIIWQLRLPRALLAVLVGGGLSVVGVAMQALVRNPLAEPYLLGISSGASAGASLFFLGFLPPVLSQTLSLQAAAFGGGLVAITVVVLVARTGPVLSVARLLLAGVAMSALMASVTAFVTYASPDPQRMRAVLFWLMGSLHGARWAALAPTAVITLLGVLATLLLARPLDALLLGEEPARHLGIPVEALKRVLIVLAALVTGTLVASSGAIGFVGLIVPHAVRAVVGVAHRRVVPVSFLLGAVFLLWADLAARTLLPGQDLPVGMVTALCGVPFFLVLLRRSAFHFG